MRPRFIIALFGLALLVVGAALCLKQYLGNGSTPAASNPERASVPSAASNIAGNVPASSAPVSFPPLSPPPTVLTPEQREAAIDAEVDRLQEWSLNNDPASLSNILADLTYPEKKVRGEAIEAAKQFGSTNAIPVLKGLAAHDEDPEEKAALLEAADFLSLPSLTFSGSGTGTPMTPEQIQKAQQNWNAKEARRQALMQKRAQNQPSQSAPLPASGQSSPAAPNP